MQKCELFLKNERVFFFFRNFTPKYTIIEIKNAVTTVSYVKA